VRIAARDNYKIAGDQFDCLSGTGNLQPTFAFGDDVKCCSVIGYPEAPGRAEFRPKVNAASQMN